MVGGDSELPEELIKYFESWLKYPFSCVRFPDQLFGKTSLHKLFDSNKTAYASYVLLRMELDDILLVQFI